MVEESLVARNQEQNLIALTNWLNSSNGCDISHLRPHSFPSTGRGLQTSRSIGKDEVVVSIPRHLMVSCSDVLTFPPLRTLLCASGDKYTAIEMLAAFLLYQKHLRKKSLWWPYIDSLPSKFLFTVDAEVIKLYPPFIQHSLNKHKSLLDTAFVKLYRAFSSSKLSFSKDEIFWAYMAVNTRTVYIAEKRRCDLLVDTDRGVCALAPYLDLLNHSYDANISASLVGDHFRITTHVPYKASDQVFINYGAHDNVFLFTEYGFILPRNPYDGYQIAEVGTITDVIRISGGCVPNNREEEVSMLDEAGTMFLTRDGPSWSLEAVTNTLLMPESLHTSAKTSIYQEIDRTPLYQSVMCRLITNIIATMVQHHARMMAQEEKTDQFELACDLVKEIKSVLTDCLTSFQKDCVNDM